MKTDGFDRIIGMDLSKRTFKACILTQGKNFEDRKIESGSMTPEGRQKWLSTLSEKDVVAIEGGTSSNNFARELVKTGAKVFVLNPGKLHIIFQSQRKTDKNDAVKIAQYIRDTHDENICSIEIPTEDESLLRQIINSYDFAKKARTQHINKLHSIFNMNGFPCVKKKDLKDNQGRIEAIAENLTGIAFEDAALVERLITEIEISIERYLDLMRGYIIEHADIALPWLSLPGIGLITCASLLAYIGDCKRFYSPAQLRNYIGLVPRIDQSGDKNYIGGVSSFGCKAIRKNIVQGGWSFDHRKADCPLSMEWIKLVGRGKRKQTVAIHMANKMLTIGWTLLKKKELYHGLGDFRYLKTKLKKIKIETINISSFPELA